MKNDKISNKNIMEDIINIVDKPIFFFNKWKDLKYNKKAVLRSKLTYIMCWSVYFICIYFLIINAFFGVHIRDLLAIPILFILCYLIFGKRCNKMLNDNINLSMNSKFYFYDNLLIIQNDNKIIKVSYDKLQYEHKDSVYSFHSSQRNDSLAFSIKSDSPVDEFDIFLNELNNKKDPAKKKILLDKIHNNINKYRLHCTNKKNNKTLKKYYHENIFLMFLYISIILIYFISFCVYKYLIKEDTEFFLFMQICCLPTFIILPIVIIKEKRKSKQIYQEELYFYENFFLIETKDSILKYEYSDIKSFSEDNNSIYIKVKSLSLPIIIDKQLCNSKFNLLGKIKASKILM